jgi:hypothetical protein
MHFENLLFILLVAVAFLFQLLTRAAKKAGESSSETDRRSTLPLPAPPVPRAAMQTDEERIRKFLEALGQPTTAIPPPPVVPRTDIPPRPLAPVQPPSGPLSSLRKVIREASRKRTTILHESPVGTPGEWLREESVLASTETGTQPTKILSQQTAELPIAASARPTATNLEITTLLSSAAGLRNAIILREIFGPPRSLQPLDLVGSA